MSTTTAEVTTRTATVGTIQHVVTIGGTYAGVIIEECGPYAGHFRFCAAVAGMQALLGWHSSLESAVAAITEVHELRSRA